MLSVSHNHLFSYCLCRLTVPKGTDDALSALEKAIPTLDLTSPIPLITTATYPAIRPDIAAVPSHGLDIAIQIDTTDTHFIYTYRSYHISEEETVNHNLQRAFSAIQSYLAGGK